MIGNSILNLSLNGIKITKNDKELHVNIGHSKEETMKINVLIEKMV